MPLDTIYLTRHGHRLNFTVNPKTGQYTSQFQTPTGNPADPILTSHGVQQSRELAVHLTGPAVHPKLFRVYSSPFYRCLQTIQPSVEKLRQQQQQQQQQQQTNKGERDIEKGAILDVRLENGVGEWFGPTSWFHHPSPSTPKTLETLFPTLLGNTTSQTYNPILIPSTRGESISQLHDRLATTLETLIADLDAEISAYEASHPDEPQTSKAVLICSHAAPLIALGRALTGYMPEDSGVEDFNVFTAGLSTFARRSSSSSSSSYGPDNGRGRGLESLAPGTKTSRPGLQVPAWQGGRGVGGGWDCIRNGDCSFLSGGAERGWHFNGEESFDPNPNIGLESASKL